MSHPASSFPADAAPRRAIAPWLLFGGPALVVLASAATFVLAARSDDGVVSSDYYRLGLLVNRRIAATLPSSLPPQRATLVAGVDGRLSLTVEDAAPGAPHASSWSLTIADPSAQGAARTTRVVLEPVPGGWAGTLPPLAPGRKVVTLASEHWQFPVTVVNGDWGTLSFGAAGLRT